MKHTCHPPAQGFPGDLWTCMGCGRRWYAAEAEDTQWSEFGLYIIWEEDE